LLALKGMPAGMPPTIGALAERLQLRHHSAVELVDRMEARRLVRRFHAGADRRQVLVRLTPRGKRMLPRLSLAHRAELRSVSPSGNRLGALVVLVPAAGALVIGFMARYGSERIRGHGIPEAIESILIRGSRIEPRVAFLKPLSAAISIGSGGPFGAEGPIIMTGGA